MAQVKKGSLIVLLAILAAGFGAIRACNLGDRKVLGPSSAIPAKNPACVSGPDYMPEIIGSGGYSRGEDHAILDRDPVRRLARQLRSNL